MHTRQDAARIMERKLGGGAPGVSQRYDSAMNIAACFVSFSKKGAGYNSSTYSIVGRKNASLGKFCRRSRRCPDSAVSTRMCSREHVRHEKVNLENTRGANNASLHKAAEQKSSRQRVQGLALNGLQQPSDGRVLIESCTGTILNEVLVNTPEQVTNWVSRTATQRNTVRGMVSKEAVGQ